MTHKGDAVLHADDDLLPDPLGDQAVAEEDHGGASYKPDGKEQRELVVKAALQKYYFLLHASRDLCFIFKYLFRIVFESKEDCIHEYQPSDHTENHETVSEG